MKTLREAPILHILDSDEGFILHCDASNTGLGSTSYHNHTRSSSTATNQEATTCYTCQKKKLKAWIDFKDKHPQKSEEEDDH
ncbi:hypothetical protein TSAR_014591 [Trichomalopsis sarcophagae]|uniref:Uncharacterized protein n=1 Tax=Trichomalopsis sarcophagae TaxID=543379 RepID=A0A232EJR7_9HYME|nr:hypothetical protein TSAR_014591 [Trichomalopsis sarcophagae]